jgi:hypothetical protein
MTNLLASGFDSGFGIRISDFGRRLRTILWKMSVSCRKILCGFPNL